MTEHTIKTPVRLLFLGSPLLDITAHCSQEILDRYGLKSDDCIRETHQQTALLQWLLENDKSQMNAGGSSQNSARIAKWALGDRGEVSFAGCVGKDEFASRMKDRLLSEGVEPFYVPLDGEPTGICACLLRAGADRSMIARLGAAERFSAQHLLDENISKAVREADCIFIEGYFLSHSPDVVLALADTCSSKQVFSLSLSAEYICRDCITTFLRILPRIDVLMSNEAEAKVLAKSLGLGEDVTVEEIARILATRDRPVTSSPRIVLVTRGPNSVVTVSGSDSPSYSPVPGGVRITDSVGCGDAMAGGFLAVYVLTRDLQAAVETGVRAAVEIGQVPGCNPPTHKIIFPV